MGAGEARLIFGARPFFFTAGVGAGAGPTWTTGSSGAWGANGAVEIGAGLGTAATAVILGEGLRLVDDGAGSDFTAAGFFAGEDGAGVVRGFSLAAGVLGEGSFFAAGGSTFTGAGLGTSGLIGSGLALVGEIFFAVAPVALAAWASFAAAAVMPGLVFGPLAAGAESFLADFFRAEFLAMMKNYQVREREQETIAFRFKISIAIIESI